MTGRRAGPPPESPSGATAATRVALADLVTGVFQSRPLDAPVGGGEAVSPVAVAEGVAESSASADGAACKGSGSAGGATEGAGCSGGAGAGSAGETGGPSGSLGFWVRVGSAGFGLSAGSCPQNTRHRPGDVVDAGSGSGDSAVAGLAGRRHRVLARTAADAVAEAARNPGRDGNICYLSTRAVPPLRLSGVPGSLLHPRQGPQISRNSQGSAAPAWHDRQSLFSGGSATWIFRALPRPTT